MTDIKENKKWYAIYVKSRNEKKVLVIQENEIFGRRKQK